MDGVFPFGRLATRRSPRRPDGRAELFVLGVYPSALHVRWRRPDGASIGALAVDDEPEVFWDGADADARIERWRADVDWRDAWGSIGRAGGNGSSGKIVAEKVLQPLGVTPEQTYFTDCLPYYFVKHGPGSQGQRIAEVYDPFAQQHRRALAQLPPRPSPAELVERATTGEAPALRRQLAESGAERIVTLGREAADVLTAVLDIDPAHLALDESYGRPRTIEGAGALRTWVPLTHPGNRTPAWVARHARWCLDQQL